MAKISGFITNLGKYNEGDLAGRWVDFPIDDDGLQNVLKEIGCYYVDDDGMEHNVEYEEYFFSDWECELQFEFGEYENIDVINDYAERVEALKEYAQDVLKVILEEHTSDVDEALRIVEAGNYIKWCGCDNMADVAEAMAAEFGDLDDVPERLQYYIDYEKWGRDLELEGTFLEGDGFFVEILN